MDGSKTSITAALPANPWIIPTKKDLVLNVGAPSLKKSCFFVFEISFLN
tara:strand:+ start:338 stop:484 length:147 start_codon:yes stop_codon:yes gene_type:complete